MATGQVQERPQTEVEPRRLRTRNPALEIFLWSRAALWAAALFAFLWFEPNRHPLANRWDNHFMHDSGWFVDVWARWDSGWFLRIAEDGYQQAHPGAAAFHPLYPGAVAAVGWLFFGHYVLAGVVVSLLACLAAFLLLYRLAETKLGVEGARRAVLYLAVFPTALFLQAVYSESVYLALALAAFLFAERGRFLPAAVAGGLALLTRPAGFALLPALVLFAWRTPHRARALASLLVAPLLFLVYPLLLFRGYDDPWAFTDGQRLWHRHLSPAGPLGGLWDGARAAWASLDYLVTGAKHGPFWPSGRSAEHLAAENLESFVFLLLFVGLTVVVWRRFGAPYGLFCVASLALPLASPSDRSPLLSLPRFGLVVFPFFLALAALAAGRPRLHTAIVSVSSVLLGVATVQWALWQWVA